MSLFQPYTFTGQRVTLRPDPYASFLNFASPGCSFPQLGMVNAWDDISPLIRSTPLPVTSNTQTGTVRETPVSGSQFLNTGTYRQSTGTGPGVASMMVSNKLELRPNGTNNFVIEGWVRFTNYTSARWIFNQYQYGSAANTSIYWFPSGGGAANSLAYAAAGGSEYNIIPNTANLPALNTWGHICLQRSGNVFTTYLDGVQKTTTTFAITINNPTTNVRYFGHPTTSYTSVLLFNDWRYYKGVAKYTAGTNGVKYFDPPPSMVISP